jgi:23S rRNA (cytosine1962-C5)-methyltransferase
MSDPRVILRPRRAQPFYGRHPWVFAGAVQAVEGSPADGDEVDLVSSAGNFVARGLYNSQSKIRVRLYSWEEGRQLDRDFWRERLSAAVRLRRDLLGYDGPGRACRLVFSEADGVSGLVVDRYDRWLVAQFTSLALARRRELFGELLAELTGAEGIYLRTEKGVGKLEGLQLQDGPLRGTLPAGAVSAEEDGLRYRIDLAEGQKTGFYLDQRENRKAVARYAPGRRVLDAFCYSGGFGLHAARAGATEVLCLDQSEPALALARGNAEDNGLSERMQFRRGDVFHLLDELGTEGRRFDVVVLDPPKFARARHAIPEALKGYRRLQTAALRLLGPDGILVTCCCTGLITADMLDELLAQVAASEKRSVQILERRGPSPDHPVAVSCLEGAYLKCLVARVV